MNECFEGVKKNFGFGCMRLPMTKDDEVDYKEFTQMVDYFINNGFNYFDTARGYLSGKSEIALRECLTKRYKREDYILVNKLTNGFFNKREDIRPFFNSQLESCGVDYFDYYLMHAQNEKYYKKYQECNAYEEAYELKKEGKIKHFGISFHDKADLLDKILTQHPEVEVVQIQFNYVDYNDKVVEGRKCYEVCRKHKKPVIVMEPVRGGSLVNLPEAAKEIFDEIGSNSYAGYAIRFAASFDGIKMVLSGMSDMNQMKDNISYMKDFSPINKEEAKAIDKVCDIILSEKLIKCTACRYCVDGCPKNISIPDLFECMNSKKRHNDGNSDWYYTIQTMDKGKASDCIKCGKCEAVCPQHLNIRELLTEVGKEFDK